MKRDMPETKRILIMEDDTEQAYELSELLTSNGFDVAWERSAHGAKNALLSDRFDLVITDIYIFQDGRVIPDGGIVLIGWMRAMNGASDRGHIAKTPILAISGAAAHRGNEYILNIAESVGADHSMRKPIEDDALLSVVSHMIAEGSQRAT